MLNTIVIAPPGTPFAAGAHPFGPVAVPVGVFAAKVALDSALQLSLTNFLSLSFEMSFDDQVTWESRGSIGLQCEGVIHIDPATGLPYTTWWMRVFLPQPSNATRWLRGSASSAEDVVSFLNLVLES